MVIYDEMGNHDPSREVLLPVLHRFNIFKDIAGNRTNVLIPSSAIVLADRTTLRFEYV